jgi:alpha/beta superfamily hydrolase
LNEKLKIYYIHGYLSSPQSKKGILLKRELGVVPIKYRDSDPENLVVSECIDNILKEIEKDRDVALIGSSFGGFLSVMAVKKFTKIKNLILLNPSIIPPNIDIKKIKNMPQRILKDMKNVRLFRDQLNCNINIILGSDDSVVPNSWSIEFAKAHDANILFLKDDHSFSKNLNRLPLIIKNYLDKKN